MQRVVEVDPVLVLVLALGRRLACRRLPGGQLQLQQRRLLQLQVQERARVGRRSCVLLVAGLLLLRVEEPAAALARAAGEAGRAPGRGERLRRAGAGGECGRALRCTGGAVDKAGGSAAELPARSTCAPAAWRRPRSWPSASAAWAPRARGHHAGSAAAAARASRGAAGAATALDPS
jgi:hypothetical protein